MSIYQFVLSLCEHARGPHIEYREVPLRGNEQIKRPIVVLRKKRGRESGDRVIIAQAQVLDTKGTFFRPTQQGSCNSSSKRLAIDGAGNICLVPNASEFHVYGKDGEPLLKLRRGDLFRDVDYIHDFTLWRDGRKAIIIPGAYSIPEVTLPLSGEEQLKCRIEGAATSPPEVIKDQDFIWIDGISLPRK
jgi:hypothetical protein